MRLAYDAAVARHDQQSAIVDTYRGRAAGMFGLAALIASLSATVGLTDSTHPLPLWTSWALLGCFILIGVCATWVLWPIEDWSYTCDAKSIVEEEKPMKDVLKGAATAMGEGIDRNDRAIGRRIRFYRGAVAFTLVETVIVVAGVISTH